MTFAVAFAGRSAAAILHYSPDTSPEDARAHVAAFLEFAGQASVGSTSQNQAWWQQGRTPKPQMAPAP